MPQVIGNPSRGTGGLMLGLGINGVGQVLDLFGPGDPNSVNDAADLNPGVNSAAIGSTFRRLDGSTNNTLYVKTALPNVWTPK
jgi:hypothetical protein